MFLGANSDVAILLNCCYAGQAIRSRPWQNVEFLAATDKDQYTPTGRHAGRPSFTNVLCQELVKMLQEESLVTLPGLQRRMLRKDGGTIKQPFYVSLSKDHSARAIRLTKWKPSEENYLLEYPHPPRDQVGD